MCQMAYDKQANSCYASSQVENSFTSDEVV